MFKLTGKKAGCVGIYGILKKRSIMGYIIKIEYYYPPGGDYEIGSAYIYCEGFLVLFQNLKTILEVNDNHKIKKEYLEQSNY